MQNDDDLLEMHISDLVAAADHVIGSRIALRSSGKVKEDDRSELIKQRLDLYKLNGDKTKFVQLIHDHAEKYKQETADLNKS